MTVDMAGNVVRLPTASDVDIRYIRAEDIEDMWPTLYLLVRSACDETLTTRDLYELLTGGQAVAWLVLEEGAPSAAAIVRVQEKDGNRWLDVMVIGGKGWARWARPLNAAFVRYAHQMNCAAITAHVRRGMEKWLKALDWRVRQVLMEYRIDG